MFRLIITIMLLLQVSALAQRHFKVPDSLSVAGKNVTEFFNHLDGNGDSLSSAALKDSTIEARKLTKQLYDFIGTAGTNPDNLSLELRSGALGIKEDILNVAFLDYYPDLPATISAIGNSKTMLKINKSTTLSGAVTITSNILLDITRAGFIDGDGGNDDTLYVRGIIDAGPIHWIGSNLVVQFDSLAKSNAAYLEWWGALGDGISDDKIAMERALNQAEGLTVYGVSGKNYRINSMISILGKDINLQSNSRESFQISPGNNPLFDISGDFAATTTLTGDHFPGTDTLRVNDASALSLGDLIDIRSDEGWDFDPGSNTKSELHWIEKVVDGTLDSLLVSPSLWDEYTTETVTIRQYKPISVRMERIDIIYPPNTDVTCMTIRYASPVNMDGVYITNSIIQGWSLVNCYGGVIKNCTVKNINKPGNGYGWYFDGSSNITLGPGNYSYNCRSAFDGGGRVARNIRIVGNFFYGLKSSGNRIGGTHEATENWRIEDNLFADGNIGLTLRGVNTHVIGNIFRNINTAIACNGGGTAYITGNRALSFKNYRNLPDSSDNTLALNFLSISENSDFSVKSKYIIDYNYAETKASLVEIASGDTLHNLIVTNNFHYIDYAKTGHSPTLISGAVGVYLKHSVIRNNQVYYPDSLSYQTFSSVLEKDPSTVFSDDFRSKPLTLYKEAKILFEQDSRFQFFYQPSKQQLRISDVIDSALVRFNYSDSLTANLLSNSDFESDITDWSGKAGNVSHETTTPLLGGGSIRILSDSAQAGTIVNTAFNIAPSTVYIIEGMAKLIDGKGRVNQNIEIHQISAGLSGQTGVATAKFNVSEGETVHFSKQFTSLADPNLIHLTLRFSDTSNVAIFDSIHVKRKDFFAKESHFTGKLISDQLNISAMNIAPASSTDNGTTGEIRITATHIYICTAPNTWVRAALSSW